MTIDLKALFSSNFFTRAQVDILTRLSEYIIANGGGEGGVADNTKADKVTLLIAGTGLTGGGDLSANRTFALNLVFLDGRYPALVDGKIPAAYLPPQAVHDTFVVASEAAMLALSTADRGDYAVRSDTAVTYVLGGDGNPATLANWVALPAASGVSSFKGRTGAITPAANDYTFAQIDAKPTTRAGYGITDAEGTIAPATAADYWRGDKTFQPLNKAAVGLSAVDNTADNSKPLGTAQLATLAAHTGMGLIGGKGPGTGAIVRTLDAQLYERGLSLRNFATGDGTTDDSAAINNWLAAIIANKRRGIVPAGSYVIGTEVSVTGDEIEVYCDPEAVFIGLSNESLGSELSSAANSGAWTVGTNITQDGSGIHFNGANNLGAASFGVTLEDNVTYEITWTVAGYVGGGVRVLCYGPDNVGTGVTRTAAGTYTERVTTSGATTAFVNQIRIQATGTSGTNDYDITAISVKKVNQSANTPMISITSLTGTQTARVGNARWHGGKFDCDSRNYTAETNGIGLKVANFSSVNVEDVNFMGSTDHEVGEIAGKAGTGLYVSCCDRVRVRNNLFTGFVFGGLVLTGGALAANSDDGVGALVQGNHFVKCKYGWQALRTVRSVYVQGNAYDQCYIGGAALDNGVARAARVNVTGETVRRPGKYGFQLRQQFGFVVSNNVILDAGYKIDGSTQIAAPAFLLLEGCNGGEIGNNVLRMDELAGFTGSFGIKNALYTDSVPTTFQPTDINVHDNHIGNVEFGISEVGATGLNNRYRANDFSTVTTFYDNVPAAFMPYGTYTPTSSGLTNIATATPQESRWRRVDRDILVSFFVTLDPTAAGAGTFSLTLPVDPGMDFGDSQDALGHLSSGTAGGSAHGHILANIGARTVLCNVNFGTDVAAHGWCGTFAYRLNDSAAAPPPPPPAGSDLTDQTGQGILDAVGGQQITVTLT